MEISNFYSLYSASFLYVVLACGVTFVGIAIQGLRYKLLLGCIGEKISFMRSMLVNFAAQLSILFTPFKSGMWLTKPFMTKAVSTCTTKKALLAICIEQAFDILPQFLMLPFLLLMLGDYFLVLSPLLKKILFLLSAILILILLSKLKNVVLLILKFSRLIPKKWKQKKLKPISNFKELILSTLDSIYDKKIITVMLFPTFLLIFLQPWIIVFSANAFSVNLTYGVAFITFWVAMVLGKLGGLPGGLGTRDITLGGLLTVLGIAPGQVIKIVLLYRLAVLLPLLIGGLPTFLYGSKKLITYRKSVK